MPKMHKITITLEDQPNGGVKLSVEPNLKTMLELTRRGAAAESSAVAYAMAAVTKIQADSKKQRASIVLPPGIRS